MVCLADVEGSVSGKEKDLPVVLSVDRFDEAVRNVFSIVKGRTPVGETSDVTFATEIKVRSCLAELLCEQELGLQERHAAEYARWQERSRKARNAWQLRATLAQQELSKAAGKNVSALERDLEQRLAEHVESRRLFNQEQKRFAEEKSKLEDLHSLEKRLVTWESHLFDREKQLDAISESRASVAAQQQDTCQLARVASAIEGPRLAPPPLAVLPTPCPRKSVTSAQEAEQSSFASTDSQCFQPTVTTPTASGTLIPTDDVEPMSKMTHLESLGTWPLSNGASVTNIEVGRGVLSERHSTDACLENYRRLTARKQIRDEKESPPSLLTAPTDSQPQKASQTALFSREPDISGKALNGSRSVPSLLPQQQPAGGLASLFAPIARVWRVKASTSIDL